MIDICFQEWYPITGERLSLMELTKAARRKSPAIYLCKASFADAGTDATAEVLTAAAACKQHSFLFYGTVPTHLAMCGIFNKMRFKGASNLWTGLRAERQDDLKALPLILNIPGQHFLWIDRANISDFGNKYDGAINWVLVDARDLKSAQLASKECEDNKISSFVRRIAGACNGEWPGVSRRLPFTMLNVDPIE